MTNSDYWWEPPLAGTEAEHLVGALDRLRTTFRWKADDLDAVGLRTRIGASSLTLGGLLKHLAHCEDHMFGSKLDGSAPRAPWNTVNWDADPDWDFNSADDDAPGGWRPVSTSVGRRSGGVTAPGRAVTPPT